MPFPALSAKMVRYYVEQARRFEDYSHVFSLGVDDTSAKKRHDYVTLVVDLEKKKTMFVTKGKDASILKRFKKDLIVHHGLPENITNASIDISPAFIKGIEDNFPKACITFDKFHIMKIFGKAVNEVRKKEIKQQDILRGTKYLWFKSDLKGC